jgi:hypothetical protein
MEHRSEALGTPSVRVDPDAVLPKGWDPDADVLLIAGAGATLVARPFVAHGTERVIVFLPDGVAPADPASGATIVRSRQALSRHLNLLGDPPVRRIASIRSPWCRWPAADTDALFAAFQQSVERLGGSRKVSDEFGPLWAVNGIGNLPHLSRWPMDTDLAGTLTGLPLIIVGAGPSLDKNVHLLRAAQGKAVILSVSRALRSLQSAGVTPDLAIALEPQQVAYQFEGIDVARIHALAVDVTVNPNLFDVGVPRFLSFAANTHALGWMLDSVPGISELPTGGSVSCSALSLGIRLGCDPIVLVGQDLSFAGGTYYASNGVDADTRAVYDADSQSYMLEGYSAQMAQAERFQAAGEAPRQAAATVPGYHGGTVPTSADFAHFRQWFENTALDHAGRVRMINSTEGGAYIGGMAHTPLADVLAQLPDRTVDVGEVFDAVSIPSRAPALHQLAKDLHDRLPQAIAGAQRCIRLIDKALQAGKVPDHLTDEEAALRQVLGSTRAVSLLAQAEIREILAAAAQADNLRDSLRTSRRLYALIARETPRLLAPTAAALKGFK